MKVNRVCDGGCKEFIGSVRLSDGMLLRIRFPDGHDSTDYIKIETHHRGLRGLPDEFAYVNRVVHGVEVKVPILGLEVNEVEVIPAEKTGTPIITRCYRTYGNGAICVLPQGHTGGHSWKTLEC